MVPCPNRAHSLKRCRRTPAKSLENILYWGEKYSEKGQLPMASLGKCRGCRQHQVTPSRGDTRRGERKKGGQGYWAGRPGLHFRKSHRPGLYGSPMANGGTSAMSTAAVCALVGGASLFSQVDKPGSRAERKVEVSQEAMSTQWVDLGSLLGNLVDWDSRDLSSHYHPSSALFYLSPIPPTPIANFPHPFPHLPTALCDTSLVTQLTVPLSLLNRREKWPLPN